MALVTLEQAKRHLRVDFDALDDDILLKIDQASMLTLDYVKLPYTSYQDAFGLPQDVPPPLSAGVLLWLGILFKHRDGTFEGPIDGDIPQQVKSVLCMYRKPTLYMGDITFTGII